MSVSQLKPPLKTAANVVLGFPKVKRELPDASLMLVD
jgi:hypothetical protein